MSARAAFAAACLLVWASPAFAWHFDGCVYCDRNGNGVFDTGDIPLSGVFLVITNESGTFYDTETTDANGCYRQGLPDFSDCYRVVLDETTLPEGAFVIDPASGVLEFCVDDVDWSFTFDWPVDCPEESLACWLTGGGTKFCNVTGTRLAECGPQHSFGGNVFPSCDPDPGQGGQWNNVAHAAKLHFQGRAIDTVACGNVPGIEPGSESPVTPFNFIEFKGSGTLKGIKGNKDDFGTVYFFARCEDRNEPGSGGAKDGVDIDRYFLHVFSDPADPVGTTLLLVDEDGDATTVDPIPITGGNLQIHISSCGDPPAFAK